MTPPSTIAHYRIVSKLGEGGMGAVYRASDTKLNRDVAIKVLPDAFAQDVERMVRFEREAKVLASLNHPNIAAIYGIEDRALVMELVDGSTLADRIKEGGALPFTEVVNMACQIADALVAAHEGGIVHRDLKPANIKITSAGVVKVLDFGLAKVARVTSLQSVDETQPLSLTNAVTILGTPSYMSPEQAQGQAADKRADVWAFGVVLYEMSTGRRLFKGSNATEVLAAVLTREPDWDNVPEGARRLLRRCLEKDPKRRLRDIGEARFILEEPLPPAATRARPLMWMAAAGVLTAALATSLWISGRAPLLPDRPLVRLNVDLGPEAVPGSVLETKISPDGRRLAFIARAPDGKPQLAIRPLDRSQTTLLAGTENAVAPFFSLDGQWIGFFADGKLKKIAVQGGAVVTIANANAAATGASWGDDQTIVTSGILSHLQSVSANGGAFHRLLTKAGTRLGEQGDATHRWPQILRGGRAVLFTSHKIVTGFDDAAIEAVVVATGERKTVLRGGYYGRYVASGAHGGYLLYVREGTLFAVSFDPDSLTVRGTPTPVLDDVAGDSDSGAGQFDFGSGTLVYRSGAGPIRKWPILWLDSSGKTEPLLAEPGAYYTMRFAPDGKRLALMVDHGDKGREIEVYDWQRGSLTRLTSTGEITAFPVWSPDGKYIVFEANSPHGYGIAAIRSDGSGTMQRLGENNSLMIPFSFSPDGHLVYTGGGAWSALFDTSDPDHLKLGKPVRLGDVGGSPNVSPDGHWIAYRSEESGRSEVYVRPFPGPGAKWQISIGGSGYTSIEWAPNGRELYFVGPDNRMMVADYRATGDSFIPGKPRVWSNTPIGVTPFPRNFSMSPVGKRFAVMPPRSVAVEEGSVHVTFVLNFLEELERRLR